MALECTADGAVNSNGVVAGTRRVRNVNAQQLQRNSLRYWFTLYFVFITRLSFKDVY